MKKPIKAITNVIELKPGKKYLLVFKCEDEQNVYAGASRLIERLKQQGITGFGIALNKGDEVEVIEAA